MKRRPRQATIPGIPGLSLALATLVLAGCTIMPGEPDLERLYETARTDIDQPPVILIPGLMGSRLESADGTELWTGSMFKVLFSNFRHAALEIHRESLKPLVGDVRPTGLTNQFAGRDFYDSITRVLENAGGYTLAEAGTPPESGNRHYYVFAYDWRLDNVITARRLDAMVEQIRRDHDNPNLEVDIIAHSMGGLIARYWMRYGTEDVTIDNQFPVNYHGENRVRRIVLLGTPNLGSVESLKAFIVGRRIGLRTIPPEVLITFPSFYQMFPHPLNDWLIDINGEPIELDPFDLSTWQRFEWSIFDPETRARIRNAAADEAAGEERLALQERYFQKFIERGRRFMWSLTVALDRTPWGLVVFGGDCHLSPARMVVEETNSGHVLHLHPDEIDSPRAGVDYGRLMLEPGDGVVTKASLLARESLDPFVPRHKWSFFPLDYPLFLCEEHSQLTTNLFFQNNLLNFLLDRDGN